MEEEKSCNKYGWVKDRASPGDKYIRFTDTSARRYMSRAGMEFKEDQKPAVFDVISTLKNGLPDCQRPYNQGALGSCTAQGAAFAFVFEQLKAGCINPIMPSRLDLYYRTRLDRGTLNEDSGATIGEAINTVLTDGVSIEKYWSYDPSKYLEKAPDICYAQSVILKGMTGQRIDLSSDRGQDAVVNHLKTALLSGHPIVHGFRVYKSFEGELIKKTSMMQMPQVGEGIMGGHCTVIVGYDDTKQAFRVRNSWGNTPEEWTVDGYFYMPYAFAADSSYCTDFWVISSVTTPDIAGYDESFLVPVTVKSNPPIPVPNPPLPPKPIPVPPLPPNPSPWGPLPPNPSPWGPLPPNPSPWIPLPPNPSPWIPLPPNPWGPLPPNPSPWNPPPNPSPWNPLPPNPSPWNPLPPNPWGPRPCPINPRPPRPNWQTYQSYDPVSTNDYYQSMIYYRNPYYYYSGDQIGQTDQNNNCHDV